MPGSRREVEKTRLNSVCPWRIKITPSSSDQQAQLRREAPLLAPNVLAVVPPAPHVVKVEPRPRARYFNGGRARKGDGRVSAILRHHPVCDGSRVSGAAPAQRAWAAYRKRAAPRIVRAARAAGPGKGIDLG